MKRWTEGREDVGGHGKLQARFGNRMDSTPSHGLNAVHYDVSASGCSLSRPIGQYQWLRRLACH